LFVDDDMLILSSYRRIVQRENMDAEFALSGTQALKWIISGDPPDVVVSDLMMPPPGGDAVYAQAVAADPSWKHRFVFVSGVREAPQVLGGSFNGPLLAKPVEPSELIAAIRLRLERTTGAIGAA
jgi:DNA-binding response OmpR family regulator